jgi:anti-sigma regulatory factor (Ser/Thr protein kinase)
MPLLRAEVLPQANGTGIRHIVIVGREEVDGKCEERKLPPILAERVREIMEMLLMQIEQYRNLYDIPALDTHALMYSAEEFSTNAYRYGNNGDPRKRLIVDCKLEQDNTDVIATIAIEDEGRGITDAQWNRKPEDIAEEIASGDEVVGGMGIMIARGMAEQCIRIHCEDGKRGIVQSILRLTPKKTITE